MSPRELGPDEKASLESWGLQISPGRPVKTTGILPAGHLEVKESTKRALNFFEQRKKFLPEATLNEIVELTQNLAKQHVTLPPLKLGQLNLEACRKTLREIERQSQLHRQSQLLALAPASSAAAAPAAHTDPMAAVTPAAPGTLPAVRTADSSKSALLLTFGASLERWVSVWEARAETTSSVLKDAELTGHHRLHKIASLSASQNLRFPSCSALDLLSDAQPCSREPGRSGVSLAFLLHFAEHVSSCVEEQYSRMTTRQVVEQFVLPRTASSCSRFCDTLPEALVGYPRFLVSHRWDAGFPDMVAQLMRHFQGQDPELVFLHIDVFSVKQLGKEDKDSSDRALLFAQLQDTIKEHVQQTLVILDHGAIVLTRAWVLWEIYCTLMTHPQLPGCVCVLGYGVQWSFVLHELLLRIDFSTAEGANRSDVEHIKERIEKTPDGMIAANRVVSKAVCKSAGRQAKHAEKLLLSSHGHPSIFIGLKVQQAIMARVDGRLQEAEKTLWGVLDYMIRGLHGEPEDLAFAVEALVDDMLASGMLEEFHRAALLCLTTQERLERCLGPEHPVCLRLAYSHAAALLRAGQAQASEQLARLTLSRQEKVGRPLHELLDSLVALAFVNRAMHHAEEAEANLLRAVKLGEDKLGWGHPLSATALRLLGEWCHDAGHFAEAAVWLVQARAAMSKVYSSDSTSWVQATLQLSTCMLKMDDLEAAEKLLMGLLKGQAAERLSEIGAQGSNPSGRSQKRVTRGLAEENLVKELGGQMFNVLHQLLFILVTSTHAAPPVLKHLVVQAQAHPLPPAGEEERSSMCGVPPGPQQSPFDSAEAQQGCNEGQSVSGGGPAPEEGKGGSVQGCEPQLRTSSMRLMHQQSQRMHRLNSVALLEEELARQASATENNEDDALRTMNDVLTEATIIVTRLLFLFDEERGEMAAEAERLSGSGTEGAAAAAAQAAGPPKKSLFRQQSLYNRAMTVHGGGAERRASRPARSVFSARPLERKFKVRHRALPPLPDQGTSSVVPTPAVLPEAAPGAGSVAHETSSAVLPAEGNGGMEGAEASGEEAGPHLTITLAPINGNKQKQGASLLLEQRKQMLVTLSQAVCAHSEVLREGGDVVGATLTMQLGLGISQHLSGPGDPEAIAGVAAMIDLLVNKHRFTEARQQLSHQLAMPAMSEQSKESLKAQVERYMTEAAFKATVLGDCQIVREAMALGARTSKGSKQLMVLAASHGQRDVVNALLRIDPAIAERADSDSATHPLAAAAAIGHRGIVEDLLALKRVFVDVIDVEGRTPLVHAALNGHATVASMLIAARPGANVNARYIKRYTPLIGATICGHAKIVELLLGSGADADALDQHGQTALFHAILAGHVDIVSMLLAAGCSPSIKDHDGGCPLTFAADAGRLDMVSLLASHGADVDACDRRGTTALMHAAGKGWTEVVDLLLLQEPSIRRHDAEGKTALMHAAKHGHLTICCALLVQASVQDTSQPVSISDPDARNAIQLRVDQALLKAGVKLPTNSDEAAAVTEVQRLSKLPLASSDTATCLKALEVLRLTGSMLTLVRMYACMLDASGITAADIAETEGHEELTQELRTFTRKREELV